MLHALPRSVSQTSQRSPTSRLTPVAVACEQSRERASLSSCIIPRRPSRTLERANGRTKSIYLFFCAFRMRLAITGAVVPAPRRHRPFAASCCVFHTASEQKTCRCDVRSDTRTPPVVGRCCTSIPSRDRFRDPAPTGLLDRTTVSTAEAAPPCLGCCLPHDGRGLWCAVWCHCQCVWWCFHLSAVVWHSSWSPARLGNEVPQKEETQEL